jgi:hypothetical protein
MAVAVGEQPSTRLPCDSGTHDSPSARHCQSQLELDAGMCACCKALRDAMVTLGCGVDGGKDSLSMAARVEGEGGKEGECDAYALQVSPEHES